MQSADPAHLFQSDYSLTVGAHRAEKAARTSSGAQYGSPIWLGHKHSDVEKLASGGAGADGGPAKILDLIVRGGEAWTAESGGVVRRTDLEVSYVPLLLLRFILLRGEDSYPTAEKRSSLEQPR